MESPTDAATLEPQPDRADEATAAERLELLAEELRAAIRRKVAPRD